ncbi:cupin domain-containing protein [Desulfotomaculum sp. 1211_IL3151]|uniref:cupin domain-containing protein n=1 Tax=Desulfotomaculum sp. 1211_IL3151 TaxID=3084055 RepID=UPI002FD8B7B7
MKALITAADVENRAKRGEKQVFVGPDHIITPSARDRAREMGLTLTYADNAIVSVPASHLPTEPTTVGSRESKQDMAKLISQNMGDVQASPELIERIVKEVLAVLGTTGITSQPVVEKHHSGVRLIHGDTIVCEPFSTGNPRDKVALRDVLPLSDSPNMCAGIMKMEQSAFQWELRYDEYQYVIEGELEIIVDGQTYGGKAGDVFFVPKGTTITFSSPASTKFFYVSYPANWREQ